MTDYENFVMPKVFLIGYTNIDLPALCEYLKYTKQEEFLEDIMQAKSDRISDGEVLCSFYAKLCYASLKVGKNKNISKVRSIEENIKSTIASQHGSVFEHASLNFVVTDCSRVYTHEQVRHRVGTAYSQTSGRYVRSDELNMVVDPILEPVYDKLDTCRQIIQEYYKDMEKELLTGVADFDTKKRITSALRRILPNGQANEIGVTENLRTLRQVIEARTSRHAEWEIRVIYNEIYSIVQQKFPLLIFDSHVELIRGLYEVTFENKKI